MAEIFNMADFLVAEPLDEMFNIFEYVMLFYSKKFITSRKNSVWRIFYFFFNSSNFCAVFFLLKIELLCHYFYF
jgi:hypothetical protein